MHVAVLSIGDELVCGITVDTNAAWIGQRLQALGGAVVEVRTVGDDRDHIARAIEELLTRCDLLLTTGGLGPTPDDQTREALGEVLTPGMPLERDERAVEHLKRWYADRGRSMPESNLRQVFRPVGTSLLENELGTAMGLIGDREGKKIVVLPGVPFEMKPMFDRVVPGLIQSDSGACVLREMHTAGIGESAIADLLGDMLDRGREPLIGTSAATEGVTLRIRARGSVDEARLKVESDVAVLRERLGAYFYGCDEESLGSSLAAMLRAQDLVICTVESCTGGLIAQQLTAIPGSSDYFAYGWVTYSNQAKRDCVGVSADALNQYGAVSAQVAKQMAAGGLNRAGADLCIAVTGVAGPGGGTDAKPVGTVFIACAMRLGGEQSLMDVRRFALSGDRTSIRRRSASNALQLARFMLLGQKQLTLVGQVSARVGDHV